MAVVEHLYPQCSCICVSVDSTAFSRALRGFLSYHCLTLLGQFQCRSPEVNRTCFAFHLQQKRAGFIGPGLFVLKVYGRISALYGSNVGSSDMLIDRLMRTPRTLWKVMLLLHDHARPHTAVHTAETTELQFLYNRQ